jgi:hypothetical protein
MVFVACMVNSDPPDAMRRWWAKDAMRGSAVSRIVKPSLRAAQETDDEEDDDDHADHIEDAVHVTLR